MTLLYTPLLSRCRFCPFTPILLFLWMVSVWHHVLAHRCRGRVLAKQGNMAEATAAFEAAVLAAQSRGLQLYETLAVRDLCEWVLDKSGKVAEGQVRLDAVATRLASSLDELARVR